MSESKTDVWEGVPPEYKWTAVDGDGRRWFYVDEPRSSSSRWDKANVWDGDCFTRGSFESGVRWRESLEARPVDDPWEGVDPKWKFRATDANGGGYHYENSPIPGDTGWRTNIGRYSPDTGVCPDWRESLIQRPEGL